MNIRGIISYQQRKWFCEMEKMLWRLLKWQKKGFRIWHKLNKVTAGFEMINSNFERNSTVGKIVSQSTPLGMLQRNCSWKEESIHGVYFIVVLFLFHFILYNCHSHPNLQQWPLLSISRHQHIGKTLQPDKKEYNQLKDQVMVRIFQQ